jgi:hypothetical protein
VGFQQLFEFGRQKVDELAAGSRKAAHGALEIEA